ncbi:MAG TPA: archaeal heat shock protein Hsp20 [Nitrososphaeraceae archaeon]|nr:archaeal heat shock protein Hsp20 [Nitrososphaeraceae archaeon]
MSNKDIIPNDWFKRFISRQSPFGNDSWNFNALVREFDEMRNEMERAFSDSFKNIENRIPQDLVKEYETPEGEKVREVGPIVYGYSMTIGPDGQPNIREFGNVKSPFIGNSNGGSSSSSGSDRRRRLLQQPSISSEREPLVDISSTDKEVKVIVEMPGIKKENIKINAYETSVEISSNDEQRKYHKIIDLPPEADIETVKSKYNNGILEVIFNKKIQTKPKGKEVKVE